MYLIYNINDKHDLDKDTVKREVLSLINKEREYRHCYILKEGETTRSDSKYIVWDIGNTKKANKDIISDMIDDYFWRINNKQNE